VKQTVFEVVIHEGINRQIRRMFQVLGYSVKKLKRIKIGTFSIKNLQRGKFIELDKKTAYAIIRPENTNRSAKS
jgi:pseudouridine synthase